MTITLIENLNTSMYVGKDLYNGDVLVAVRGDIITEKLISEIKKIGYFGIYTATKEEIMVVDKLSEKELTREITNKVYEDVSKLYSDTEEGIPKQYVDLAKKISTVITDCVVDNKDVLISITDLRTVHNYTYNHSINVSVLSAMMALELGYSYQDVQKVTMAALLHDIGKRAVPAYILNKPEELTPNEFEIMKRHSEYGYDMLEKLYSIPEDVKQAVLQHHEKKDGSGYPLGLKGEAINAYARIITVADIYDALVSKRAYHDPYPPSEAVELLMGSIDQLDSNVVMAFCRCITIYPLGCIVQLSNGEQAIVTKTHKQLPLRPSIIFIKDKTKREYNLCDELLNIVIEKRVFANPVGE